MLPQQEVQNTLMMKKNLINKIVVNTLKITSFTLSMAALLILCFLISPWKSWVSRQAEKALSEQGFENPKLTIKAVTPDTIILKDITIGTDRPIRLTNLAIGYDINSLLDGSLNNLNLGGLDLFLTKGELGWHVPGFSMSVSKNPNDTGSQNIPMTKAEMELLPFDVVTIRDSNLTISDGDMHIEAPFSASIGHNVSMTSDMIDIEYGEMQVSASNVSLSAHLNDNSTGWSGMWSVADISSSAMTSMSASGTLKLDAIGVKFSGELKAKDESGITAKFTISNNFASPDKVLLTLNSAIMPWAGGLISVKNIDVPVFGTKPITMPIYTQNVSIDDVMRVITGEYVSATGTISGTIPVTIRRDGIISIGDGHLKGNDQGKLSMPPDLIPGQGEQIKMTREILENFQYKFLDINTEKINDNKISVLLAIKGNNPDMYNGREVHLNVRLSGDLLDIIRSNVMLILQPEKFMNKK